MTMLTKEEFVKTHPDLRMGMIVYSMEGEKLGVVEQVDEDNLIIERGWFFHKDSIIRYDDIVEVREDRVVVRQRPEDFAGRRAKEGQMSEEPEFTGRTGGMGEYERGREEEVGEVTFEEEEIRIPVEEEEVEPAQPAQKEKK
jgi:uncharacterized protein YrrD